MCECCGGDCKLCNAAPAKGFFGFPTEKNMTQPLNEAYHNEVLEAYQKISDTFDDFTQLMRKRVPYEEWPDRLKIAGVSDSLKGEYEGKDHCQECKNITDTCICHLEEIINKGWRDCQPSSRPDESFRAMMQVMLGWKKYLDTIPLYANKRNEIVDLLKAQGIDPLKGMTQMANLRLETIGKIHMMLMEILKDDIFHNISSSNPYWKAKDMVEQDKLENVRGKLNCLRDNLWEIIHVILPRAGHDKN